jgi:uncharacterized protein involved in copper resistance
LGHHEESALQADHQRQSGRRHGRPPLSVAAAADARRASARAGQCVTAAQACRNLFTHCNYNIIILITIFVAYFVALI